MIIYKYARPTGFTMSFIGTQMTVIYQMYEIKIRIAMKRGEHIVEQVANTNRQELENKTAPTKDQGRDPRSGRGAKSCGADRHLRYILFPKIFIILLGI